MSFDLIAVNSYKIGDHRIAVPQRLDPERRVDAGIASSTRPARRTTSGHLEPGVQPFRDLLSDTPEQYRPTLTLMADWTEELASTNHNITAATYFGLAGDVSLLPRLKDENVGLVTLWRYNGGKPAISFWRSVFERRAPHSIAPTERLIGKPIGQGTTTNQVTRELLTALENAYQSASSAGR